MSLRRGFRRITFVLAVVAAVICAGLSISTINEERYWAQGRLRGEQKHLRREQKRYKEHLEAKQHPQKEEEEKKTVRAFEDISPFEFHPARYRGRRFEPKVKTEAELKQLESKVKELEKGFWVTLSSRALVGLFVLAGSGGAVAAFVVVWLFYLLIKWVVRGFTIRE